MRLNNDQVLAMITQAIDAAGGSISHDALMAALDEQGAGAYAHMIVTFSQPGGPIQAHLKVVADGGPPKLTYRLRQ